MSFKRGDIVLVLFPDSNLRTAKRRPALVIQADHIETGLSQIIIAMITSNLARGGQASRVVISLASDSGQQSGLKADSVIMADNLATVNFKEIDRRIGSWTEMQSVDRALRHTLAL